MTPSHGKLDDQGLSEVARRTLSMDVQVRVAQAWAKGRALMLNAKKDGYSEAFTIKAQQYTLIRDAIFEAIDLVADERGEALLKDIQFQVQERLGEHSSFPKGRMTNYTRYTKVDMEARGELERVPKSSPQRVRRPPT